MTKCLIDRGSDQALDVLMGWCMSHPLRWYVPDVVYEITTRTIQERFLLTPGREARELIIGVIGRALLLYRSVKVCAFVYLSNHYHMLASASDGAELAAFLGYINGNVAREMGRLHGWRGRLWARRARTIPILDPEAVVSRLRYLLSNGVKEGLVASPCEWPGASSTPGLLGDMRLEGTWIDRDDLRRARMKDPNADAASFSTKVEVKLSPLPQWEGLDADELRMKYESLVRDVEADGARLGLRFLGARAVMAQDPHSSPEEPARGKAPLCHTTSDALRRAFKSAYRAFVTSFRDAATRARTRPDDASAAAFPPGSFPRPRWFQKASMPLLAQLSSALDPPMRPELGWGTFG